MRDRSVPYIERSEEITGYRVKIMTRPSFQIAGFTAISPPKDDGHTVSRFVADLIAEGRLDALRKVSSVSAWILGLGSWDQECRPDGLRYTRCVEETQHTDLRRLAEWYPPFGQRFEACNWMCFEVPQARIDSDLFWKDDPYRMLRTLGYRFHLRVGVHFDASMPRHDEARQAEECEVCPSRDGSGNLQPFG